MPEKKTKPDRLFWRDPFYIERRTRNCTYCGVLASCLVFTWLDEYLIEHPICDPCGASARKLTNLDAQEKN